MSDRKLPRPRAELAQFQPYRTQMLKAEVRINANEWPEPNVAGRYITAEELNGVLLNRYPGRGDDLREILSARWGTKSDRLILGNGSNELLLQVFLVFGGHGRKTLLFHPTYSMHGRLTQLAGGTVVEEMVGLPYEVTKERALATMAKVRLGNLREDPAPWGSHGASAGRFGSGCARSNSAEAEPEPPVVCRVLRVGIRIDCHALCTDRETEDVFPFHA